MKSLSAEATTIVALLYSGGRRALLAADRRATSGHRIAKDDMTKLFLADRDSAVAIAGAAGVGVELARLFALELEHVEKIERAPLSHEGKVRRLSMLVNSHLTLAMQGLGAAPIIVGFDHRMARARIHTFDATGGAYEELSCAALGSGGEIAQAVLDSSTHAGTEQWSEGEATKAVLAALDAASRRDTATSGLRGPSLPLIITADESGARHMDSIQVERIAQEVRV